MKKYTNGNTWRAAELLKSGHRRVPRFSFIKVNHFCQWKMNSSAISAYMRWRRQLADLTSHLREMGKNSARNKQIFFTSEVCTYLPHSQTQLKWTTIRVSWISHKQPYFFLIIALPLCVCVYFNRGKVGSEHTKNEKRAVKGKRLVIQLQKNTKENEQTWRIKHYVHMCTHFLFLIFV